MKKIVKRVALIIAAAIMMMVIGFGIATAVYSSGIELKVPHIKIEWTTINHDLWLMHYSTTDSETAAKLSD